MSRRMVSLLLLIVINGSLIFLSGAELNTMGEVNSTNLEFHNNLETLNGNQHSLASKLAQTEENPVFNYAYDTNFETNSTMYKPGNFVVINGTSTSNGINGSLSWSLTTPNDEDVFSFTKNAQKVFFDDPLFQNTSVVDWTNDQTNPFTDVSITALNNLNLTTASAGSTAKVSTNKYNDINGTFNVVIQYTASSTDSLSNLTFSYWNGTHSVDTNLPVPDTLGQFETVTLSNIVIDSTSSSGVFNFTIANNSNAQWIIRPITINYAVSNVDLTAGNEVTGVMNQIWVHGVEGREVREHVTISYDAQSFDADNKHFANFVIELPKNQLYLGEWLFKTQIIPFVEGNNNPNSLSYVIPFTVTDDFKFTTLSQYILRGYNETTNMPIYEDETGITSVYSPTNNITLIGDFTSQTTNDKLDAFYFSDLNGKVLSNSTGMANIDVVWGQNSDTQGVLSQIHGINPTGTDIPHGNGTTINPTLQTNNTWFVNYRIPNRGIYGNASQQLKIDFPSKITTTASNNQTYSQDYTLSIDLNPISIKFKVNITDNVLPENKSWVITEFLEGNFSVKAWNYNLTQLSALYNDPNQSINWQLDIPLSDLDFTAYLANSPAGNQKLQTFSIDLINDTFYFKGIIDPNLKTYTNYEIRVDWNDALNFNDTVAGVLAFTNGKNYIGATVVGTLTVNLPSNVPVFTQGQTMKIEFNVSIDQLNNKKAYGLHLNAFIDDKKDLAVTTIIELGGTYIVADTLPVNLAEGQHTLNIYVGTSTESIGVIQFSVIPPAANSQDYVTVVPDLYTFIGAIFGIVVIATFIFGVFKVRKD